MPLMIQNCPMTDDTIRPNDRVTDLDGRYAGIVEAIHFDAYAVVKCAEMGTVQMLPLCFFRKIKEEE